MTWLYIAGGLGTVAAAMGFAFWRYLTNLQAKAAKSDSLATANETQGEVLEDVKKANAIRDKLRTDADYAKRVRERYSRPPDQP